MRAEEESERIEMKSKYFAIDGESRGADREKRVRGE